MLSCFRGTNYDAKKSSVPTWPPLRTSSRPCDVPVGVGPAERGAGLEVGEPGKGGEAELLERRGRGVAAAEEDAADRHAVRGSAGAGCRGRRRGSRRGRVRRAGRARCRGWCRGRRRGEPIARGDGRGGEDGLGVEASAVEAVREGLADLALGDWRAGAADDEQRRCGQMAQR